MGIIGYDPDRLYGTMSTNRRTGCWSLGFYDTPCCRAVIGCDGLAPVIRDSELATGIDMLCGIVYGC